MVFSLRDLQKWRIRTISFCPVEKKGGCGDTPQHADVLRKSSRLASLDRYGAGMPGGYFPTCRSFYKNRGPAEYSRRLTCCGRRARSRPLVGNDRASIAQSHDLDVAVVG